MIHGSRWIDQSSLTPWIPADQAENTPPAGADGVFTCAELSIWHCRQQAQSAHGFVRSLPAISDL